MLQFSHAPASTKITKHWKWHRVLIIYGSHAVDSCKRPVRQTILVTSIPLRNQQSLISTASAGLSGGFAQDHWYLYAVPPAVRNPHEWYQTAPVARDNWRNHVFSPIVSPR